MARITRPKQTVRFREYGVWAAQQLLVLRLIVFLFIEKKYPQLEMSFVGNAQSYDLCSQTIHSLAQAEILIDFGEVELLRIPSSSLIADT